MPYSVVTAQQAYSTEMVKAKTKAISGDTHQLQLIKLQHFKLESFKSICDFLGINNKLHFRLNSRCARWKCPFILVPESESPLLAIELLCGLVT